MPTCFLLVGGDGDGGDARAKAEAEEGFRGRRRLVPERLHQAVHAVHVGGRAEVGRDDVVVLVEVRDQRIDAVGRGGLVLDELFEEGVVEVGEVFEEFGARLPLAVAQVGGDLDEGGGLSFLVVPGAFGDEVDGAGDLAAFADRDLAEDDGVGGVGLERRHRVADAGAGLIHAVDEEEDGDAACFHEPQVGGGEGGGVGVGGTQRMAASLAASACAAAGRWSAPPAMSREAQSSPR